MFTLGDLIAQYPDVVLKFAILLIFVLEFSGYNRHCRQRRTEFMRSAGSQRAQCNDLFVTQSLFACQCQILVALANGYAHLDNKPGD